MHIILSTLNFKFNSGVLLYRLPYFSHVSMSIYFTFQTTDISIRYRLLQTYNKCYKTVSKLVNLFVQL